MLKIKQNLIWSAIKIYNLSLAQAQTFIEEISNDVFFFGSSLLMALIQNNQSEQPFELNDFDMVAVLNETAPKILIKDNFRLFNNGQIISRVNYINQQLVGVCDHEGDLTDHAKQHELDLEDFKVPKMFLPGETCNNCTNSHFYLRKWFWNKNMHCRNIYSVTHEGIVNLDGEYCVASPLPTISLVTHPENSFTDNTDIIFVKKVENLSLMETAFINIERGPRLISHICFGKENGNFKLIVRYPDMVRKRKTVYKIKKRIDNPVWEHLIHYTKRGIADLVIKVPKTSLRNFLMFNRFNRSIIWHDYDKKEKENHVNFIFKRIS